MRLGFLAALAFCLALAVAGPSSAQIARFGGRWENTNANTKGLVSIEITVNGNDVSVHGWGACSPTPCDWGTVDGTAYAPDVSSDLGQTAEDVTAVFKTSFAVEFLTIQPRGDDMFVTVYTRFTDSTGRTSFKETGTFRRAFHHIHPMHM